MLADAGPDPGLGLGEAVEVGGSSSWGAACREKERGLQGALWGVMAPGRRGNASRVQGARGVPRMGP